ncbi:MAG: ankyrin repeat domain-containing protein [Thiotrichaceae bacterium]|nr:ankyrin repeat domain-containing protein [Thiotrichaceae bacterium]
MIKFILTTTLVLLLPLSSFATNEAYCTSFALRTTNQYWNSYQSGCPPNEDQWNGNYNDQYHWCLKTHKWMVENANEVRTQMFTNCQNRTKNTPKPSGNSAPTSTLPLIDKLPIAPTQDATPDNNTSKPEPLPSPAEMVDDQQALNTLLLEAISKDDLNLAKVQLKKGADLGFVTDKQEIIKRFDMTLAMNDNKSESLLSYAVNQGSTQVGLWIIEKLGSHADSEEHTMYRSTLLGNALIKASKERSLTLALQYIKKGADVNYKVKENTPLFFAIRNRDMAMTKLLLSKKADPNHQTKKGSLLSLAIKDADLLNLLLNAKADPNAQLDKLSQHPLNLAIVKKQASAIKLLLAHSADMTVGDYQTPPAVIQAIKQKNNTALEMLIRAKVDLNSIYGKAIIGECSNVKLDQTALDIAKKIKNTKAVKFLEKAGAKTAKQVCHQD